MHLGCLCVLVDVDVDVIFFFFIFNLFLRKQNPTFEESLNGYWDGNCIQHIQAKQAPKKPRKFYLLSTLWDISMRFIRCVNSLFSKPSTMNAKKKKWKIFLFHYREYLDLKQHVDQLRNKQKHLRSQRDVSNIQSL